MLRDSSHTLSLTYIHSYIHTYYVSVFVCDFSHTVPPTFFSHTGTHIHTFIHIYIQKLYMLEGIEMTERGLRNRHK